MGLSELKRDVDAAMRLLSKQKPGDKTNLWLDEIYIAAILKLLPRSD